MAVQTASITVDSCLSRAVEYLLKKKRFQKSYTGYGCAVSVGIYDGVPIIDLDYSEDLLLKQIEYCNE
ncbi:MAG: hypothetical protein CM15mP58_23290 [Burkholderiaceae bacterium]|nr:MAG: hypothetical protein CM15mP58_23290 [Burkholderiaceae bacterium]